MSSAQARIDDAQTDVQATGAAARGALASAESARHSADLAEEVSDTAKRAAQTATDRCVALLSRASEQAATEQSRSALGDVVAVAKNAHAGLAHRIPNLGERTATLGVAHCGYLAEHMTLVPDMSWDEVDIASRCEHCEQEPAA